METRWYDPPAQDPCLKPAIKISILVLSIMGVLVVWLGHRVLRLFSNGDRERLQVATASSP